MKFEIKYTGREIRARQLLLKQKIKTADELAVMATHEVEQAINVEYEAYDTGENWLLVPRDSLSEFNDIIKWVKR